MCGLAGFFLPLGGIVNEMACRNMTDTLRLRGPDDDGIWVNQNAGIAMGHRRLSVQDLSPFGHQPMESSSSRYVIVYNGEVYNFQALQKKLEKLGCSFRGHSDTEVMLAAIEQWGLEQALTRFVGMFAFALWDKKERVLTLARDRIGEKPLYYGWQGESFLFASELKALKVHPDWRGEINRDALALYMRYNNIPAPYSIYKGIYKLMPGTVVQIPALSSSATTIEPQSYWQAKEMAEFGVANPLAMSDNEAVEALDRLLGDTIQDKMISDVPLGAFLSGGIDSSLIVALMQQESSRPVKSFSIGFHEHGYNEAEHAKAVATHLGTEHTELYVTSDQAMDVIPRLPLLYDEPFSDSSQIPTFLVSEMTKRYRCYIRRWW
jgi:asparagine synthase (glutamine-hydrolysing)